MQVFAILTLFGELIGRVPDDLTEEKIEAQGFIELERPLKLHIMATPQGLMNAMVPVTQFSSTDSLPIALPHIVSFGPAIPAIAKNYLEMTSGIALSGSGGSKPGTKLELVTR